MTEIKAVPDPAEAWETGELGRDKQFAECAPADLKQEIDAALEMHPISIRLQRDLISELKLIADYRGIGYQPLIRDVLRRFARAEVMHIATELKEQQEAMRLIASQPSSKKKSA